jgi:uncharacterized membrane protein (DUF373 family)
MQYVIAISLALVFRRIFYRKEDRQWYDYAGIIIVGLIIAYLIDENTK